MDFKRCVRNWLIWGRKYVGPWFRLYVVTFDLQQRGVLHAHVLLFKRVPRALWDRMRRLWVETYGMGPGSFDVRSVRRASRAAAYLARYIAQDRSEDGQRVGRNGLPYVRDTFWGNAYAISDALRHYARPMTEVHMEWGAGVALDAVNLRGMVAFFRDADEAHTWLGHALSPPGSVSRRA